MLCDECLQSAIASGWLAVQPARRDARVASRCPPDGSGLKRSAATDMVAVEIAIVLRLK
jgi:hypothetical protein